MGFGEKLGKLALEKGIGMWIFSFTEGFFHSKIYAYSFFDGEMP
jgi:hypothetical protein